MNPASEIEKRLEPDPQIIESIKAAMTKLLRNRCYTPDQVEDRIAELLLAQRYLVALAVLTELSNQQIDNLSKV